MQQSHVYDVCHVQEVSCYVKTLFFIDSSTLVMHFRDESRRIKDLCEVDSTDSGDSGFRLLLVNQEKTNCANYFDH